MHSPSWIANALAPGQKVKLKYFFKNQLFPKFEASFTGCKCRQNVIREKFKKKIFFSLAVSNFFWQLPNFTVARDILHANTIFSSALLLNLSFTQIAFLEKADMPGSVSVMLPITKHCYTLKMYVMYLRPRQ